MKTQGSKNRHSPIEQIQEKPGKDEFLIVAIGASAGGIQALQQFFRRVPQDSGMAYVVILHLSPYHDSQLAAVLQRETKIPVTKVMERVRIRPDHIYVVSPNQHLTIEDDYIAVSTNVLMEERRAPVDICFRSLADEHGPRAIAVILSGTGANGSMGLKRIKERGGACFVQNPREAEFNEMPRNAIATDMVDEILQVADIPGKIISYKTSLGSVEIVVEPEHRPEDQQQALREIFTQIRVKTGHDFSNYKRPTLLRRIERRINIRSLPDLPAYSKYLVDQPNEANALLKDLLISVTNFFRDKKPFEVIEHEVLPSIFKGKKSEDQIRIWVAGCATGEEAYSIAMLCAERTIGAIDAPKVQIFATDIDESSIAQARDGLYSFNDTADVSPERLRRFFNKEGDRFRVRREIRETVMFAHHNFLNDPPFSHLDMVSCRNVLIYLNSVAQERVIDTFHFALKPGSYLFLGSSESVDASTDLYAVYNRENHIFQSRQVSPRAYPIPESTPSLYFDKFKNEYSSSQTQENKILERISFGDLHQQLLEQYAPPSLIINEEYNILHLSERAGKYLQIGGGELSQSLLNLVKPELRLELRSALYQAVQRHSAVETRGLKITVDDKTETVNIHVRPVLRTGDTAKGFMLVIFEPSRDESDPEVVFSSDEPVARQLEDELTRVKTHLRAANEQHDFQAEEMKAANEELQAMNEELRSAAEELETSKEELQSINEELRTVNQELKVKIEETSIASNNLQNLINSTDIGTIFLDRSFRVALFTPAAGAIFNLIPTDFGRPLSDITNRLKYQDFLSDAEAVLDKLNPIEKEVHTYDDKAYFMRVTPYRTDEDRIKGVVLTFFDISERRKTEEALRQSEEKYRIQLELDVKQRTEELNKSRYQYLTLVENTPDVITRWDKDLRLVFANTAFDEKTITAKGNLPGKSHRETGQPDEISVPFMESLRKSFDTGLTVEHFYSYQTAEGVMYFYSRITPEKNEAGHIETVLSIARDITDLKKVEAQLNESRQLLQSVFDASPTSLSVLETLYNPRGEVEDFKWLMLNPSTQRVVGDRNVLDERYSITFPHVLSSGILEKFKHTASTGEPADFEQQIETDGGHTWSHIMANKVGSQLLVTTEDITQRKQAELEISTAREFLQSIIDSSLDVIQVFEAVRNKEGDIVDFVWKVTNLRGIEQSGDVVGKRLLIETPGVVPAGIFDRMIEVMESGVSVEREQYYDHEQFSGNWFNLTIVKQGDGVIMTTHDITVQKKSERELLQLKDELAQRATDKYLQLFNSIDEGFCIIEVLFNEAEEPYDYRFIEANKGFEKQTNLLNAVGKTIKEMVPDQEQIWFDIYGRIVKTGKPERFENEAAALGFYYEVYAFRVDDPGQNHVAVLFKDITKRKDEERHQAFLLKLSDALRPLQDAALIQQTAMELIGVHMGVNRAYYSEVLPDGDSFLTRSDYFKDVPSLVGSMKFSDFDLELRQTYAGGRKVVINDVSQAGRITEAGKAAFAAIQFQAGIGIPLVKEGELLATVSVHQSVPRRWTKNEISLLSEVAERTWAAVERAKAEAALRDSEQQYRTLFETMEEGYSVCEAIRDQSGKMIDYRFIQLNPALEKLTGMIPAETVGKRVSEVLPDLDAWWLDTYQKVIDTRETIKFENFVPQLNKWYSITAFYYGKEQFATFYEEITERKKAQEAIRISEAQLRVMVENLPGGAVFIVDKDLRYLLAEGEALASAGLRSEELVGRTVLDALPADIRAEHHSKYRQALAGEPFESEHKVHGHTFVTRGRPLKHANGEVYAALAISYDISERIKAEEALNRSEERLRVTMETAVDFAIITMNSQRLVEHWNTGGERILGFTSKEIQGKSADLIFTDEDRAAGAPEHEMQTALKKGFAEDERWHQRKDGSRLFMSGVMRPIYNPELTGYVKIARDMTNQKQAEQQLRIFEERNRVVLQSAEMAAWDWNIKDGKVVWNEQHYLLFGLVPADDEKDAAYFLKFVHQDDKESVKAQLAEAVDQSGTYKAEFRIIRADNQEIRWMSSFGKAIERESEKASRMVGGMFDITDRKKLEQQKEEFLTIASHELKTPVTSIKAYGEILESIYEENADVQSASLIHKLNAQVTRLNNLISDLLDTTKITEGQLMLVYEDFDLVGLINQLVEELQQLSRKHKLVFDCKRAIYIHADRKRIEQVITNLVSNAFKYSPEGGTVTIDCEVFNDEARIRVADEGIGISRDSQEKIFNRFFRVQQVKANAFPGMGLGLYITAGIIRRHGGTISVDSNSGKGSVFHFTLPVKNA